MTKSACFMEAESAVADAATALSDTAEQIRLWKEDDAPRMFEWLDALAKQLQTARFAGPGVPLTAFCQGCGGRSFVEGVMGMDAAGTTRRERCPTCKGLRVVPIERASAPVAPKWSANWPKEPGLYLFYGGPKGVRPRLRICRVALDASGKSTRMTEALLLYRNESEGVFARVEIATPSAADYARLIGGKRA